MKLTIIKSDFMGNWYIIERAEHDGRTWLERADHGARVMLSSRFSDADVEGDGAEMLEIANAIEKRCAFYAKRCAVRVDGQVARFRSPRNSLIDGECTLEEADELARLIRATVVL